MFAQSQDFGILAKLSLGINRTPAKAGLVLMGMRGFEKTTFGKGL